jgi:hypothetical protein
MKLLVSVVVAAALLIVVPSSVRGQVPHGKASVKLSDCDTVEHSAQFQGTMQAFGRATGLQMRFTLQSRDAVTKRWARVGAPPPVEEWLTAAPGVARYVYDKGVDNLPVGADYRALVRFRFRTADGTIVGRAIRTTRKCRQPDERPNLEPIKLRGGPVQPDGTRNYELTMENNGDSMSGESAAALDVNGVRAPLVTDPGLAEDDEITVWFTAAACPTGSNVTATVDVNLQVDEQDETDNSLTIPCPVERRGT